MIWTVLQRLLAEPGVSEVVELRSSVGFMAIHGGSLEGATDVIASDAAARAGASLYAVLLPPQLQWHVPSHHYRAEESAGLAAFLDHVDVVVAVHGYGRDGMWTSLLLGGRDRAVAADLGAALRPALPDYEIVDDLDAVPVDLRGLHPDNPVNRTRAGGVQLELPPRVRGHGPVWSDWSGAGPVPPMAALIDALAAWARSTRSSRAADRPAGSREGGEPTGRRAT
ncbi:MAG: hypothetical protein JWO37_3934 [Acidimicrobiales bacterium]|jgi:phage replication-related protein YjqB (UPF0714/DUF867 family)|nr:hypothetical protein [Acidimicrobiales bacterium]